MRLTSGPAMGLLQVMRLFTFAVVLAIGLLSVGCAGSGAARDGAPSRFAHTNATSQMTPSSILVGKVVKVNVPGRFVVLNFPIGRLPALNQRLNIYRGGGKIGEVRITGPQSDDNVVADVTLGGAEVGDTVRDQ